MWHLNLLVLWTEQNCGIFSVVSVERSQGKLKEMMCVTPLGRESLSFPPALASPVSFVPFIVFLFLLFFWLAILRKQDKWFLASLEVLLFCNILIRRLILQFSHFLILKTIDTRETAIKLSQFKVDVKINVEQVTNLFIFPQLCSSKFPFKCYFCREAIVRINLDKMVYVFNYFPKTFVRFFWGGCTICILLNNMICDYPFDFLFLIC